MASTKTERKLTAILSADPQGYSRLMGADEEATIETLTPYRKVFTSEIKKHRGREVLPIPPRIGKSFVSNAPVSGPFTSAGIIESGSF